jgi:hypothetical protein
LGFTYNTAVDVKVGAIRKRLISSAPDNPTIVANNNIQTRLSKMLKISNIDNSMFADYLTYIICDICIFKAIILK